MPLPILRLALLLALTGYANSQQLAAGNLLLATAKSRDSDFARSVVLLIHYDAESAIGLMLNKPTTVPMSERPAGGQRQIGHDLRRWASQHRHSWPSPLQFPALFLRNLEQAADPEADLRPHAVQLLPHLRRLHRLDRPAVAKRDRAWALESDARESWDTLAAFGRLPKALT